MIRRLKGVRDESGFALVSVLVLLMVGTMFALAAWSTSKADIKPTASDRYSKQAYAAAEAGLNYYLFRLSQNNAYWSDCDQVPPPNSTEQNPVNLAGATTLRWRNVPGTQAKYAIELLPQNNVAPTGTWCAPGSAATGVLLDKSSGILQVRSTGQSNGYRRSVVATLRRSGFLDYLYFTTYETEDPQVSGSGTTCDVYRRAGRSSSCSTIVFGTDDVVNGPFHTNDDIITCGTPEFGRTTADAIEISGGGTFNPTAGWAAGCNGSSTPDFKGTKTTGAPTLTLPSSNSNLQNAALSPFLYTGTTQITLKPGNKMDVINGSTTQTNIDGPGNGVIYVKSAAGCGAAYNGTGTQKYDEPAACGNVYVKGTYSKSLTIGADRDIIINDNLTRQANANALLGLIANYFVRVYHPVSTSCGDAASGPYGPSLGNLQVDAAILSLQHSFIVDNYRCGTARGTLTVNGAIGQYFRGPVGQVSGSGYIKNYNYDDRFRVANPPYFLDPVQSSWRKIRFNEESPPRQGG
jgi:Tfp pilus assembly protein PilX